MHEAASQLAICIQGLGADPGFQERGAEYIREKGSTMKPCNKYIYATGQVKSRFEVSTGQYFLCMHFPAQIQTGHVKEIDVEIYT